MNQISLCGAAALNIYTDIEIQGFGLPVAITASLSTHWIQDGMDGRAGKPCLRKESMMGKGIHVVHVPLEGTQNSLRKE